MTKTIVSANHSIDESNSKVAKSKDDKNCGHDKISKVKAYLYLFRSLALRVVLKKGRLDKSLISLKRSLKTPLHEKFHV